MVDTPLSDISRFADNNFYMVNNKSPLSSGNSAGNCRKLIFVNRYFYPDISATSQMLSDLAFRLAANGELVSIVTSRSSYEDLTVNLKPREEINNVEIWRTATSRFGRWRVWRRLADYLTFYVTMLWRVYRIANKGDWIIAKTDPPMMSIPLVVVAWLRGSYTVNWLQDVFPEVAVAAGVKLPSDRLQRIVFGLLTKMRDWSLHKAQFNVVLSQSMKDHITGRGINDKKVEIIPNWADIRMILPEDKITNSLIEEWQLTGKFVVGYSGNLGIAHEYEAIVEAANKLRDNKNIIFLIVGGGFRVGFMKNDVKRLGLSEKILFKPYQDRKRLSETLGAIDLHLVSLRPELNGLIVPSKFYGITAAGRPTVFIGRTDCDIAKFVAENQCGISVDSGDGENLAEAILLYAEDPDRCVTEGKRARRLAERDSDIHIVAQKWTTLFASRGEKNVSE